ncbi:hypothetical protein SG34_002605 [Thalassomonas viridans]|uniref:Uncharacterized protein n=1 Tax=Thalassomonas viridans TaxID=137584 RepID=A0AAE9Z4F6_9GAMM|nr:hypothetical protein [Thalassomonas viridans]WDE05844.1 hypothetical protein SG34_002605 [Thalassomonas viridans]
MKSSTLFLIVFPLLLSFAISAQNRTDPDSAYDCTKVQLEPLDESKLTREEKLAQLDESLFDAIDSYSTCIEQVQTDQAASGGGGGGAAGSGDGNGLDGAMSDSEASTQSGEVAENSEHAESEELTETTARNTARNSRHTTKTKDQLIAPKDNDLIVCGILWENIQAEKDQTAKEKLHQEYKRYNCG